MTDFKGVRALIIEDDQTSINVLQSLLTDLEVTSDVIYDSYTLAENLQATQRPDVIFLDLEMPSANGYTVLEYIRNDAAFEGVPVVAYTTHTSHMNEARRAGFDSFLGKPLSRSEFAEQLEQILNGESIWSVR
ncbi:MAG: response regulator [Anaerolineae bacterium]|nr:response regulator [Anaerolineae bacterium]